MAGNENGKRKLLNNKDNEANKAVNASEKGLTSMANMNPLRSVGMKLFLLIFGSILACVLTIGLMAYDAAKDMVERKVSEASLQTVTQVASNLETIITMYEDMSLQILIDRNFHAAVRDALEGADDYTKFEAVRRLSDSMQYYALGNSSIRGIMLIPIRDGLNVVTAVGSVASRVDALKESDWFQQTVEYGGRVNWIPPQPGGLSIQSSAPTIGVSRLLKDSTTNVASYVLLIEIDVATITNRYKDVVLGENSEFFVVDRDGTYVVADNYELIGQQAKFTLPASDENDRDALKLTTSDGVDVLASYKQMPLVDWRLVGTIPVEELVSDANAIRDLTWMTALAAVILAIAIGGLVVITIARPLVKLRNLMNEGAGGNLTVRSSIRNRRDEIGGLSESFNRMMTQITELALRTTRSAEEVLVTASDLTDASRKTSLSAKEIAVATEEIAGGATSLAVEAEKGNELTTHINEQMRKVIDANQEMVASAADVEQASGRGTAYMSALIEKTSLTEEMTRSMVDKVDSLKESTGSIVKILDVLNSLTKQTNILSLNATIEAARAGAAGKGFMVVADEIRKLADQSRQSIDIVAQITEKIGTEIGETVQVLSDAHPLFQEQIGSVKDANEIFVSVQDQMGRFVKRLDGVTDSVSQLDQSQAVLAEAMTNVSAVAEEASATSEEVASLSSEQLNISDSLVRLSEKLDAVSKGLKESLSQFKI